MTYVITHTNHPDGRDTASVEYGGGTIALDARNGALGKLARAVVSLGAPDGPWRTQNLSGASLHGLACLTVDEASSPRLAAYSHPPMAEPMAAPLAAVIDAAKERRRKVREMAE